ncbi:MAG: hypothetical protein EP346_06000 [Bacteroidetes bacterium]|nr:MAG: hypothetical protein EP346_06000 [Bacteroidota bacterium]
MPKGVYTGLNCLNKLSFLCYLTLLIETVFMHYAKKLLLLFTLLLGIFFASESYKYLELRPQGPHQWRQTDCASFTLNYAKDDLPLLEPSIHKLFSDNGTTGKTAGEFPLLYYFVGQVWKVTGQNEPLYRIINLSIFCLGLLALFRAIYPFIRHRALAYLLAALPLSIPVITYYAPNFLQNSTALSMVFIAWSFVSAFIRNPKIGYALLATLFFALGGLLKITALISFLALLGTLAIDLLWKFDSRVIFKTKKRAITILSTSAAFVLGSSALWYKMARDYCTEHGGWFTFNDLWPIWRSTPEYIQSTFDRITDYWKFEFFTGAQYILLVLAIVFVLIKFKRLRFFEKSMIGFLVIGNLSYFLLWFNAAYDHDYYFINLYALPVFLLFVLFKYTDLSRWLPKKVSTPVLWALTIVALGWSASSASKSLHMRYNGWINGNGHNQFEDFFDITPYLRNELKIDRKVPVIVYPDPSYSISLYLADQVGWPIRRSANAAELWYSINLHQPAYILVNDTTDFNRRNYAEDLPIERVGNHKSVDIYQISKEQ